MPTIIALDTSLSMQRFIPGRSDENALTYHQLAVKGVLQLLDYLMSVSKLEYVCLVTCAMKCKVIVDFTRDYDQIRQAVKKVESGDKLCLTTMLKTVSGIFSSNWGTQNHSQIVLFTDCGLGFRETSLLNFIEDYVGKEEDAQYAWMNPLRAVKLNFVCMGVQSDIHFTRALPIYQQLIDFGRLDGQLFLPKSVRDAAENGENTGDTHKHSNYFSSHISAVSSHKSELGRTAMFELIERVCEANFKLYESVLKCGGYFRLECPIYIWPPPLPCPSADADKQPLTLAPKIEVCGYIALPEIGSPASLSRHLIIPKVSREKQSRRSSDKSSNSSKSNTNNKSVLDVNQPNYEFEKLEHDIRDFYTKDAKDTDESGDDGDISNSKSSSSTSGPSEIQKESMCVLLHGALKVENLAALVQLNENWYGFLYSYADSKKKSNLMLNILPPGNNVIPWLGDLHMLGFVEDLAPGETSSFPVKADKRSYSQNCVVWIKHVSLQSDIQKVLRHAKKIPEKTQNFYKELNRIRRAALSLGFTELLEALATLFEKESAQLSLNAHPEYAIQLKHAAIELRKPSNRDFKASIVAVQKFGSNPDNTAPASTSGFGY